MNFLPNSDNSDQLLEINITPLVDIVFLLLIFLMVSTSFIEGPRIDVKLPTAASKGAKQESSKSVVSISENGDVYLGEAKTSLAKLETHFREQKQLGADSALIIRADKGVSHGRVVEVMDLASELGISKMAIATTAGGKS